VIFESPVSSGGLFAPLSAQGGHPDCHGQWPVTIVTIQIPGRRPSWKGERMASNVCRHDDVAVPASDCVFRSTFILEQLNNGPAKLEDVADQGDFLFPGIDCISRRRFAFSCHPSRCELQMCRRDLNSSLHPDPFLSVLHEQVTRRCHW
jgi:hypothetical protein